MTDNRVTLKDVYELIKELKADIDTHYVRKDVWRAEMKRLESDIADVKNEITTLVKRIVYTVATIATVVGGALGFVLRTYF